MISAIVLVLLVAAVASFTRLVHEDVILAPWRADLREKRGMDDFWVRMLECFRCTAIWVAKPFTLAALLTIYATTSLPWEASVGLAVAWYPFNHAVAYLAYLLYLKGEN